MKSLGSARNIFYPAADDSEHECLFERNGELLLSLLKKYLVKALPSNSTLCKSLCRGTWNAVLDAVHFDSAKAPLLCEDIVSGGSESSNGNLPTIREVVLQAHSSRQNEQSRFDCVGCVDQYGEQPNKPFRAQVLKFFQITANLIVDDEGNSMAEHDSLFALVGSFRTVVHKPYNSYSFHFEDGWESTRAALLGKTIIKLPPNHIKTHASKWQTQRFFVIPLRGNPSDPSHAGQRQPSLSPFRRRSQHASSTSSNGHKEAASSFE